MKNKFKGSKRINPKGQFLLESVIIIIKKVVTDSGKFNYRNRQQDVSSQTETNSLYYEGKVVT